MGVLSWLLYAMDVDTSSYSKTLAGIFQAVMIENKNLLPGIEDFIDKCQKLEVQIKTTLIAFTAFNESLFKVAEQKSNSKKGMELIC